MASVCGADFYLCEGPSHFSDVSDRTLGKQTRRDNSGERPCDTEHFMSNVMNIIRICREKMRIMQASSHHSPRHTHEPPCTHTHTSHGHTQDRLLTHTHTHCTDAHTRDLLHTPHTPCTRHAHATQTVHPHQEHTHTVRHTHGQHADRQTPSTLELTCKQLVTLLTLAPSKLCLCQSTLCRLE